jgi:catechol 2,3-dioxygenase-like lactoylglutathione lyase family enzyme
MTVSVQRTKLVVRDVDEAERFYTAIGLKIVRRIPDTGGSKARQRITWVSGTGDESSHVIALSRFLNYPASERIEYPGRCWLVLEVSSVDETVSAVEAAGGSVVVRSVRDASSRSAVVRDHEGRGIEIVELVTGR